MRKAMIAVLFAATLMVSCKKDSVQEKAQPIDVFFRLALVNNADQVIYSKVITTKSTTFGGEVIGDSNPGNGNGHYDGDGCDENKPNFCEKHPWHKKCQILELMLDYFVLTNDNKTITVNWKAIDETTLVKYTLQRSTDASTFKDVINVAPKGANVSYSYKEVIK